MNLNQHDTWFSGEVKPKLVYKGQSLRELTGEPAGGGLQCRQLIQKPSFNQDPEVQATELYKSGIWQNILS
jgi:hypothetical protein